jgi:hypothetical protein
LFVKPLIINPFVQTYYNQPKEKSKPIQKNRSLVSKHPHDKKPQVIAKSTHRKPLTLHSWSGAKKIGDLKCAKFHPTVLLEKNS